MRNSRNMAIYSEKLQSGNIELRIKKELELRNIGLKYAIFSELGFFSNMLCYSSTLCVDIYLFIWILTSLSAHYIRHITTGSFMGIGNQYIHLVKVLYCKLLTNGKQLPDFPLEVGLGT